MKTKALSFLSLLILAVLVMPNFAHAGKKNKEAYDFTGKITSIDAAAKTVTITQKPKKGGESKTFNVSDATKITVDGQPAVIGELRVKMKAKVLFGTTPGSLVALDAKTHKRKKEKAAASAATPAAASASSPTPTPAASPAAQ